MARNLAVLAARASSLAGGIADHIGAGDDVADSPAPVDPVDAPVVLPDLGLARLLDFVA